MRDYACMNWLKYKPKYVDADEYNKILRSTRGKKYLTEIKQKNVANINIFCKTYQVIKNNSFTELRIDDGKNFYRYICILRATENQVEDLNNGNLTTGQDGYNYVDKKFKAIYNKSIFSAYSGYQYSDVFTKVKRCVPAPINYHNTMYVVSEIKNCYEADESSSYPSKLLGTVPTFHRCQLLKGRVEPSEEYPFAFYIKSRHMKIFNELDTHNFNCRFYKEYLHYESISEEEDETVLCKASKYSFKDIMLEIYQERKSDPLAKSYMNTFIGYCHRNSNPTLSCIGAVVMARCVNVMIQRAKALEEENNIVMLINTDSIIWHGQESKLAVKDKNIGNFVAEYNNFKLYYKGVKAYQLLLEDGTVITKLAGMSKSKTETMKFKEISKCSIENQFKRYMVNHHGYIEEY